MRWFFLRKKHLPPDVRKLVAEIAAELDMPDDWLNFGPSPLRKFGFPPGLTTRLIKRVYGPSLTVYFIGRLDQIHFKLFAAMDPGDGTRHLVDLLDLKPERGEVEKAVAWLSGRKTSHAFAAKLDEVLDRIGHA